MRNLALAALLLTAGPMACCKSPLDPTQAPAAGTTQDTGAPAQHGAAAPDSSALPPGTVGNCEQTGEHTGECGSPGGDSTETPGEAPETEGAESSGP